MKYYVESGKLKDVFDCESRDAAALALANVIVQAGEPCHLIIMVSEAGFTSDLKDMEMYEVMDDSTIYLTSSVLGVMAEELELIEDISEVQVTKLEKCVNIFAILANEEIDVIDEKDNKLSDIVLDLVAKGLDMTINP